MNSGDFNQRPREGCCETTWSTTVLQRIRFGEEASWSASWRFPRMVEVRYRSHEGPNSLFKGFWLAIYALETCLECYQSFLSVESQSPKKCSPG